MTSSSVAGLTSIDLCVMAKSCGEDDMMINIIIRPPEEAKRHSKEIHDQTFTNPYQALPYPMLSLRNHLVLLVWSEADHDTSTMAYQILPTLTALVV